MTTSALQGSLAVLACAVVTACGHSSAPASPSPVSALPSPAIAGGSFGVLARTASEPAVESQFARCLGGSRDAACFSAVAASSGLTFASQETAGHALSGSSVGAAADVAPDPPSNLTFSLSGSTLFLFWQRPLFAGSVPLTYLIEAGSATGTSDLAAFTTGTSATFFSTTISGGGTFYVRVRAVVSGGTSLPSNEVVVTLVNAALPGAPFSLSVTVNGSTVTLSWSRPFAGGAPTTYIIQASSTAGGAPDLANFATGNTLTTITAFNVAPGTYFVRILAANNAGVGPATPDRSLIVFGLPAACTVAPGQPSNLVAIVNGSSVTLGWSPSTGAVTSYVVEAGSAAGLANLATADTGSTAGTATFNGVGRGTYYVRVRGKNACGPSGASNEIQLVVQ